MKILTLAKQMYPGKTEHFVKKYEEAVQRPFGYLFIDLKPATKDECRLRTNVLPSDQTHVQATQHNSAGENNMSDYYQRQSYLQPPHSRHPRKPSASFCRTFLIYKKGGPGRPPCYGVFQTEIIGL